MTANMYRVGDYVYFETTPSMPFQIRRIEELNKAPNGSVDAKVMCYLRRRDVPASILALADKNQGLAAELIEEPAAVVAAAPQVSPVVRPASRSANQPESSSSTPAPNGAVECEMSEDKDSTDKDLKHQDNKVPKEDDKMEVDDVKEETKETTAPDPKMETSPVKEEPEPKPATPVQEAPTPAAPATPAPAATTPSPQTEQFTAKQRNQLRQRELFLSRQVETLPVTSIRGKCSVTLLNETESFASYLEKEDAFFYTSVFDPVQRTVFADRGEIRVGARYQAEPTPLLKEPESDTRNMEELEVLTWTPEHSLTDRDVDQFLVVARSVGTFARALDCSSSVKQPSLHMSAAAASRDITLFHAMDALHRSNYELGKAMSSLVPPTGPILCRDQMEEWSASEANLFEEAMEKYGKDFNDVRQDFLPWKTLSSLIEYYYLWKTTDRYVQQKRVKAVEAESKLKQVYVPAYNKPHPAAIGPTVNASSKNGASIEISLGSGKVCDCCSAANSIQWYAWGSALPGSAMAASQSRLCQSCWTYWKKYGDLKVANKSGTIVLPVCNEDDSPTKVSGTPEVLPRSHRSIQGCREEFKIKSHLMRHSASAANSAGTPQQPGSPRPMMKTRTAFYLAVTPSTRLARRFCAQILRPRYAARFPFLPINSAAIRQEYQLRLSRKSANEVQALMIRAQKPMATVPKRRTRVSDVTFRLARGQILTTVPAWLILPDRFASKSKLERQAFPKPPKAPDGSLIYERIVLPVRDASAVVDKPKRRGDDSGPSEGPPFKRFARESAPPSSALTASSANAPMLNLSGAGSLIPGGSPTPSAAAAASYISGLPGLPGLPPMAAMAGMGSMRSNLPMIPAELYAGLAGSTKSALSPSSKVAPGTGAVLLPAGAPPTTPPTTTATGRSHGSRGSGLHGQSGRIKQLPTWMDAPDDLFFHSTRATKKLRRRLATVALRRAARKPWRPLDPHKT